MKNPWSWWSGVLALVSLSVSAANLDAQLEQFFTARNGQRGNSVKVVIRTPQAQWPDCAEPQFALPGNGRLWGVMSVAADCGHHRRYIQVEVQVSGTYVVASHRIARGSVVNSDDLRMINGRLDSLPAHTVLASEDIIAAVALRDIMPAQPVTLTMVRQPWRVQAGQKVEVTVIGAGFAVNSTGQAMNNASAAQTVRVRMDSGQIVSGKVDSGGKIRVSL